MFFLLEAVAPHEWPLWPIVFPTSDSQEAKHPQNTATESQRRIVAFMYTYWNLLPGCNQEGRQNWDSNAPPEF